MVDGYFIRNRFAAHNALGSRAWGPNLGSDTVLVVTHGLTMRLLLMRYFSWSVDTFDAVYNPGNCDMWVLPQGATDRGFRGLT